MPEREVLERARRDAEEGKSPSTQAGEFVREEIEHVREGKHGARSAKQAIAIGLSKARRAGIDLPPPKSGQSEKVREQAKRDFRQGRRTSQKEPSAKRSRATSKALKRESKRSVSPEALAAQAKGAAKRRGGRARHEAAELGVRTRGRSRLRNAARKAAATRSRRKRR